MGIAPMFGAKYAQCVVVDDFNLAICVFAGFVNYHTGVEMFSLIGRK